MPPKLPPRRLDDALRPILQEEILDTDSLRLWVVEARDAMKTTAGSIDMTCRECGKRQRIPGTVRDWQGPKMILELMDRVFGKPAQGPPVAEPEPEKADMLDLSSLTTEQLRELAAKMDDARR